MLCGSGSDFSEIIKESNDINHVSIAKYIATDLLLSPNIIYVYQGFQTHFEFYQNNFDSSQDYECSQRAGWVRMF